MPERIVIVGGVAGGAAAATRARRLCEEASIVLLERGPEVSFANCGLPYHIAGVIEDRRKLLVQTAEGLYARYDIDVRVRSEVTTIDRAAREVQVRDLSNGREYREPYDALILSPGAEPIRPPIPGAGHPRVLTLRTLTDMDAIHAAIGRGPGAALVVGAGYIGLEIVEALHARGCRVILVEKLPHVLGPADGEMTLPLRQELEGHGIELHLDSTVVAFHPGEETLEAELAGGERIACALAVLAVGVRPETALAARAGLALGPTGGIRVDEGMRTDDPHIWAVGDAVEVRDLVLEEPALIPLAGPAGRQGRIAADNIFGRPSRYRASQGTAAVRVFGTTFAMTGATEKALRRAGRACQRVYLHPSDHASYYPGAHPIAMKLLFDPADGRILGAQATGASGVDKRIDVLAVALRAGMTVFDLEELELCYAPPLGSARDPVNLAGSAAANVLRGDVALWEPEELAEAREDRIVLDVRTPQENQAGTLPGAVCAPVDELRDRWEDLPREKELFLLCQVGMRGYIASRFLNQKGFRARNLSGGYRRYCMDRGWVVPEEGSD